MRLARFTNNWDKVKTKDELLEMLKRYKEILNNEMTDYLNSLIELEFSIIKDYIDYNDRKRLAELEIYKRVAIYNIYNRAMNLFNQSEIPVKITGNDEGFESLNVSLKVNDDKCIKLFNFRYGESRSRHFKIPNGYKTMNIGCINMYQTLESEELRELELKRVMNRLEILYNQKNPYPSSHKIIGGLGSQHPSSHKKIGGPSSQYPSYYNKIGGPSSQWLIEHNKEIARYEERLNELDNKKHLTDEEKIQIEITNKVHDLLLEDYGLTDESFEEVHKYSANKLQKTLVKKEPNLTIVNNIKYI